MLYTSSYVEEGGEAKSVAASFLVTQPMSAKVKHLKSEHKDDLWLENTIIPKNVLTPSLKSIYLINC